MKRLMVALLAFAALTASAQAQTPKAAVGSEQVYWVLTLAVDDLEKFKSVVQRLVVATQKEEPGTLEYEYTVTDDQKTVDVVERYANSRAVGRPVGGNDLAQVLRVHARRECCRTDEVREHHRDLATLGGVLRPSPPRWVRFSALVATRQASSRIAASIFRLCPRAIPISLRS